MGGLKKRGPKHKKSKNNNSNKQATRHNKPLTDEDFKRMMEDAPVYKRSHGALHQVR